MRNYQNEYSYGSVAYQLETPYEVKETKKEKVLVRRANKEKLVHKLNLLFSILIIFSMAAGLMTSYSSVSQKQDQIQKIEKEIKVVQDSLCDAKIGIADTVNSANITRVATEKLGMVKAADYQIININVPIENYTVKY